MTDLTGTAPPDAAGRPEVPGASHPPRTPRPIADRGLCRRLRSALPLLLAVGATVATGTGCAREPGKSAAATTTAASVLRLNGRALTVDLAADEASRQLGLRFKSSLPADRGLLLVFQADEYAALPADGLQFDVDAILITAASQVAGVRPIGPRGNGEFVSDVAARFVLLVNRGLAAEAGVKAGDAVSLPADAKGLSEPQTEVVRLGGRPFRMEVVASDAARQKGLMRRPRLTADAGMIFVFAREQELGFWMKNTEVPLDIVYLDAAARVVSVKQMAPFDIGRTPSEGLAKYAIEVNRGTAAQLGLKAGDRIDLPDRVRNPPDLE